MVRNALLGATILLLACALMLWHGESGQIHARHAPNRYDRRPDRENPVRSPRPSSVRPTTRQVLHSAPPATPVPSEQANPSVTDAANSDQ
jgi:hypothetical protein